MKRIALALTLIFTLLHASECESRLPDNQITGDSTNGTGFIIVDDDEGAELAMIDLSELTRRVLAGKTKTLDIGESLVRDKSACKGNIVASCIGEEAKFYKKRSCGYKDTCRFDL